MSLFAILLLAAAVGHGLARFSRLPAIPVLLVIGMALAATGWLPEEAVVRDDAFSGSVLLQALNFCLLFLVFASGVELAPKRFARHRSAVAWVASIQFLIAAAAGYIAARWIGFDQLASFYIAAAMAASSTLVGLRQLRSRRAMFEPFGRVVTGVLLVQDLLLIAVIVITARLGKGAEASAIGLGYVVLLAVFAFFCQQKLVPALLKRFRPDEEMLLLWIVALLFVFVWLATGLLGLPMITGAFFAGFIFSAFPLNGLVRGQLNTLSDFFLALFFVSLGVLVGVPDSTTFGQAIQLSLVVVLVTPPVVAAVAEWRGLHTRPAIESGLLLAQTSEFSLILGLGGVLLGHLDANTFRVLALTTVITMTLTPFLSTERMAHMLLAWHPLRRRPPVDENLSGHFLLLGFGSAGMWIVKPLRAAGHHVLVVDDDAIVCAELTRLGIPVIKGDGSDEHVLRRAGANRARLIICSMRRAADAHKVLDCVDDVPVMVRVLEKTEARLIEKRGGIPILSSIAAADTFLEWFEKNDIIAPGNPS